jgi:hypothetical protein
VEVAESTVRQYVRKRKIELGLVHGEVFIPQTYQWGQEGQVDCKRLSNRIYARSFSGDELKYG